MLSPDSLDAVVAGALLPEATQHYLINVLRLDSGTCVQLADGAGRVFRGRLESEATGWRFTSPEPVEQADVREREVILLIGLLKPARFKWVVEKAVELGATRLVPVLTERAVVRPAPDKVVAMVSRWRRIAHEAAKQCTRPRLPDISAPTRWSQALAELGPDSTRLIASVTASEPAESRHWSAEERIVLAVGPEGGFTTDEVAEALAAGFMPVTLGDYVLRAETAAIVMLGLARCG